MNRMMYRFVAAALVLVFLIALPARGQEEEEQSKTVAVRLKDGRTFTGRIKKRDDGIEVRTTGGVLKFREDEIESIHPVVSPKDAYLAQRGETDMNSADSLYKLAKWVWQQHQEDLVLLRHARTDLRAALKINKNHRPAQLLLRQVEPKIKILNTAAAAPRPGESLVVEDRDLVTKDDIFWIRLQELRPTDRVMIKYENKVLRRYIDEMRGSIDDGWDKHGKENHFLSLPRSVQVMEILRNKSDDENLLKDIHVMRDPKFMTDFRSHIWPLIQNNCAKANCHGGPIPNGRLKFFVIPGINPRADYTNYLIVSGWNKGKKRLLNRQNIEYSLILQHGLNAKVAKMKHPIEIPPVFTGIQAENYRLVYNWMSLLKKPMAPNYHIHDGYQPAGMTLDTSGEPFMRDDEKEEKHDDE